MANLSEREHKRQNDLVDKIGHKVHKFIVKECKKNNIDPLQICTASYVAHQLSLLSCALIILNKKPEKLESFIEIEKDLMEDIYEQMRQLSL